MFGLCASRGLCDAATDDGTRRTPFDDQRQASQSGADRRSAMGQVPKSQQYFPHLFDLYWPSSRRHPVRQIFIYFHLFVLNILFLNSCSPSERKAQPLVPKAPDVFTITPVLKKLRSLRATSMSKLSIFSPTHPTVLTCLHASSDYSRDCSRDQQEKNVVMELGPVKTRHFRAQSIVPIPVPRLLVELMYLFIMNVVCECNFAFQPPGAKSSIKP